MKKAKRYKYQTRVSLDSGDGAVCEALHSTTCRMVICARHRETGLSKFFSALVSPGYLDGTLSLGEQEVILRLEVPGEDVCDYLAPGEHFTLWRGSDVGHGVVSRRLFT